MQTVSVPVDLLTRIRDVLKSDLHPLYSDVDKLLSPIEQKADPDAATGGHVGSDS
jgi:hypothetical protein